MSAYIAHAPISSALGQAAVPEQNTDQVRRWSVGTYVAPGHVPWLDAAMEVHGVTPAQSQAAQNAVRNVLANNNSEIDSVRWGSGPIAGRIYARWRPRREDNAVSYATQLAQAILNASQRDLGGASVVMRRFRVNRILGFPDLYVYPETDFTTVTREPPPPAAATLSAQPEAVGARQVGTDPGMMVAVGIGAGAAVVAVGGGYLVYRFFAKR